MIGREYSRKSSMYVDVLGLPTISEAVQEASRMLRNGLVRALSTLAQEDIQEIERSNAKRTDTFNEKKTQQSQVPKSGSRNPVEVYSAVTKISKKPTIQSSDQKTKLASGAPAPTLKTATPNRNASTATNDTPKTKALFTPKSWNSSKKAGPGILSKRGRDDSTKPKDGASQMVFQPVAKRERKTDLSKTNSVDDVTNNRKTPPEKQVVESKEKITSEAMSVSKSDTDIAKKKLQNDKSNNEKNQKIIPSDSKTTSNVTATKAILPAIPEAIKGIPQGMQQTTKSTLKPLSALRKMSSQSANNGISKKSSLFKNPLLQKPKTAGTSNKDSLLSSLLNNTFDAKNHLSSTSTTRNGSSSKGVIPFPNTTGIQTKYVPGSQIIDGVRPNGYTVSQDGVVKPVVTFNPKSKLPHKLRQNSVEKLFEAWRDVKKLPEGEALSNALHAEQVFYANSADRGQYRGAITVKLKEIRK